MVLMVPFPDDEDADLSWDHADGTPQAAELECMIHFRLELVDIKFKRIKSGHSALFSTSMSQARAIERSREAEEKDGGEEHGEHKDEHDAAGQNWIDPRLPNVIGNRLVDNRLPLDSASRFTGTTRQHLHATL